MRIRKSSLIILALIGVLCLSVSVSAISDGTGDIWHYTATAGSFSWQAYTGTNDNIDITDLDYSIEGSEVTMTMTVAGDIEDAATTYYLMHLVTGDDYYMATYVNGVGMVIGTGTLSGFYQQLTNPVSGDTFTATFTVNDPAATYEIRGYAAEYSTFGDEGAEWWGDWAPDAYFNEYTGYQGSGGDDDDDTGDDGTGGDDTLGDENGGDDTGGTGTPGFEAITLIAAIGAIFILLRKRR